MNWLAPAHHLSVTLRELLQCSDEHLQDLGHLIHLHRGVLRICLHRREGTALAEPTEPPKAGSAHSEAAEAGAESGVAVNACHRHIDFSSE